MATAPDLEWIRSVVDRYERALIRFASMVVGPAHAADVVQDTLIRLVAARRQGELGGDGGDRLVPWLFRVCKNRALELKRSPAHRTVGLEEEHEMTSHEPTAAEVLEQRDEQGRVLQALGALPERQREVVVLRFAGGLSYREIGGVTGLSETNVGFILHTALKTLKRRLAEGDAEGGSHG
jgi:RNA polymerase sigma-70 factor (ECF subfamily)